jgi:hypothetical protein
MDAEPRLVAPHGKPQNQIIAAERERRFYGAIRACPFLALSYPRQKMIRSLTLTVALLLTVSLMGCLIPYETHHFDGLGTVGDSNYAVKISAAKFFKIYDETWRFADMDSDGQDTVDGFVICTEQPDFKLQAFTVRDRNGNLLPFIQLLPTSGYDNLAFGLHQPGYFAMLVPKGFQAEYPTLVGQLKSGFYRVEITYFAGGRSHHAQWDITHSATPGVTVRTLPRCSLPKKPFLPGNKIEL